MCLLKVNIVRLVVKGKRNLGPATSLQWETISARDSWKKIRGAHNQIMLLQTHNQVSNGFHWEMKMPGQEFETSSVKLRHSVSVKSL